jgi:dTDP-4-dehydrorhamnose 3,5-epimerase
MQVVRTQIPEVQILTPTKHEDDRGFFSEVYHEQALRSAGIIVNFVQDNHSYSKHVGTVRGLHFQTAPFAQDKLIRVVRGAIFDVAVDLREGSPTFAKHVAVVLSAHAWNQLFVPIGFAHGFCTLEPETEVIYKTSSYYAPSHDLGLLWNDPALAIPWPVDAADARLSAKDTRLPKLSDLGGVFAYDPPRANVTT